jgi:hypothetical protein
MFEKAFLNCLFDSSQNVHLLDKGTAFSQPGGLATVLYEAILNCVFDSSQDVCHHNIDFHLCDEGYVYSQSWGLGNSTL